MTIGLKTHLHGRDRQERSDSYITGALICWPEQMDSSLPDQENLLSGNVKIKIRNEA